MLAATAEAASPAARSSSSSSSSSEEEEEEREAAALALAQGARAAPRDYDAHVRAVGALRQLGLLDALRDAREQFSRHFPLTPALWQAWIRDEGVAQGYGGPGWSAAGSGRAAAGAVAALYARACGDYFSADVWAARIKHAVEAHAAGWVATEEVRGVFEQACQVAGRAIHTGAAVWTAYRAFEEAVVREGGGGGGGGGGGAAYDFVEFVERQLAIPMVGSEQVMEELERHAAAEQSRGGRGGGGGGGGGKPPPYLYRVRKVHAEALSRRYAREQYETMVATATAPAEIEKRWLKYLDFERRSAAPVESLLALYDRALTPCALSARIWWDYTVVLLQACVTAKADEEAAAAGRSGGSAAARARLSIARARAVRNITYSGPLWSAHVRSCEASAAEDGAEAAIAAVEAAMARALGEQLSTPECYSTLWVTYLRALMRLHSAANPGAVAPFLSKGLKSMKELFGNDASSNGGAIVPLLRFHSDYLEFMADDLSSSEISAAMSALQQHLDEVIQQCPHQWESHRRRIEYAKRWAPVDAAAISALYRAASEQVTGSADLVCLVEAWASFEGMRGTVDGAEAVELVRATRAAELAKEDRKARMRWQLDATIAKQKAGKAAKNASKGDGKKAAAPASSSSSSSAEGVGAKQPAKSKKRLRGDSSSGGGGGGGGGGGAGGTKGGDARGSKRPRMESDASVLFLQNAPSKGLVQDMIRAHAVLGKGLKSVVVLLNKRAEPYGRAVLGYESEAAAGVVLESVNNSETPVEMEGRAIRLAMSAVSVEAAREKNGKLTTKKKVDRKMKLSFVPRGVRR
jgi:hypothetical protein